MTTPGRSDGDVPSSDELSVDDLLGAWSSPAPPEATPSAPGHDGERSDGEGPGEPDLARGASRASVVGRDVVVPDRDLAGS